MKVLLAVALLLTGTPTSGIPVSGTPDVVRTDRGLVRGDHHTFRGIPYAAPPTGRLRWAAPQPATPWSGVRDATEPAAACAQPPSADPTITATSEDCLYLNVTVPARRGTHRPVIVWVHGGSFLTGTGAAYDAHRLADQGNAVVVTINYRLGVFGYFGLPGLEGSGTFGLQDQRAALRWVRRNAAVFGGDPHNVTLAGESAGAMSTCAQLISPAAAGLFDKAIMQSGSCLTSWPAGLLFGAPAGTQWTDRATLDQAGSAFAAGHDCATVACLRARPATDLVGSAFNRPVLPADPADALRRGAFARVPVLAGTNLDEFRGFLGVLDEWTPYTPAQFTAALTTAFGGQAGRVAAAYPLSSYDNRPGLAWAAVMTDRMFACTALTTSRLLARHNPLSAYEFAERSGPHLDDRYPWGAAHGYELPYLFDGMTWLTGTAQPELAATMVGEWTRFAATGATSWPRFPYVRSLAAESTGRADFAARHQCGLWARLAVRPAAAAQVVVTSG